MVPIAGTILFVAITLLLSGVAMPFLQQVFYFR
ncbi:archaellin/type IV pilin N-terminal domain-containing protein [Virgibacillus senegalensis]